MFGPSVFLVIVHLSFGQAAVSLCLLCTSNTVAPGSYEPACEWGRPGSIQGRQECVSPWTAGCSAFTYYYVGNTGPFTGRGCCQEAPGSIYSCSGLAEESGAYNVSLIQSCNTDNCNSQPTAFGPEPTSTENPVAPPEIEVDPVPSSSKAGTEQKTEEQEEELAGRLAESEPAELDIGRNEAAVAQPLIFGLILCVIAPLLFGHQSSPL